MALYKRKEFAAKCGVPVAKVNVYIARKKITLTGKLIDDAISENDYFYKNCIKNKKTGQDRPVHEIEHKIKTINFETIPEFFQKEVKKVDSSSRFQLDEALKQAELQKKEVDTRIALLKEDKLKGRVLPTELFKLVFSQHSKSILVEFNNSVDKILIRIAKRKHLNNVEVTEIRKELIEEINKAVDRSVDESKKNLRALIDDYSNKRGKGERI